MGVGGARAGQQGAHGAGGGGVAAVNEARAELPTPSPMRGAFTPGRQGGGAVADGTPYARSRARESLLAALASPRPHLHASLGVSMGAPSSAARLSRGVSGPGATHPPAPMQAVPMEEAMPMCTSLDAPAQMARGSGSSTALGLLPTAHPHAPSGAPPSSAAAGGGVGAIPWSPLAKPQATCAEGACAWPGMRAAGSTGLALPTLQPTRLATPQLPAARLTPGVTGAPSTYTLQGGASADSSRTYAHSALNSATHLPTPKRSSLRLRSAVPPSPPTWSGAAPSPAATGNGLFHAAPTGPDAAR
mmetsp:Transcript_10554/g.27365  ORF Transcript_10554/g.27365 Transcript_10554/m.27365 type:complete len:303 (+) Transcript_10554:2-910(+)